VRVTVGELVTVAVAVAVALGTGWFPVRMVICDTAPKFPSRSRSCTVSLVSPWGKLLSAFITWQNCTTCGPEERKAGEPKPSTVHACAGLVVTSKPQAKSLSAFEIACVTLKSGGLIPGTPPPSHTPTPPFPSGREDSIWRSGRALGSFVCQLKTTVPTGAPLSPATASITNWNPEPTGRWNRREPSAANPTSGINPPSGAAKSKTATSGPGSAVGVGLGSVRVSFNRASTSAALSAPSPLPSQSSGMELSPNSCAARVTRPEAASLPHCARATPAGHRTSSSPAANAMEVRKARKRKNVIEYCWSEGVRNMPAYCTAVHARFCNFDR